MDEKLKFRTVLALLAGMVGLTALVVIVLVSTAPPTTVSFTPTAQTGQLPPTPTPTPRQSRNNGSPCDPLSPPPAPPARNARINSDPTMPGKVQFVVTISKAQYPETAAHIEAAQVAGHPKYLTIDRDKPRSDDRRAKATSICPALSGFERDEYPLAMFEEGGQGASVRYVQPGDNKGAGARIGNLLQPYPSGSIIEIRIVP